MKSQQRTSKNIERIPSRRKELTRRVLYQRLFPFELFHIERIQSILTLLIFFVFFLYAYLMKLLQKNNITRNCKNIATFVCRCYIVLEEFFSIKKWNSFYQYFKQKISYPLSSFKFECNFKFIASLFFRVLANIYSWFVYLFFP